MEQPSGPGHVLAEAPPDEVLLPGEISVASLVGASITTAYSDVPCVATVYITNYRLLMLPVTGTCLDALGGRLDPRLQNLYRMSEIPLTHIRNVVRQSAYRGRVQLETRSTYDTDFQCLDIICKTFRRLQISFPSTASAYDRTGFVNTLMHYAYPTSTSRLFAFDLAQAISRTKHTPPPATKPSPNECVLGRVFGPVPWRNLEALLTNAVKRCGAESMWRISGANAAYEICKSYPKCVVVPAQWDETKINEVATCFPEGRFPVWCWTNPTSGTCLLRSSQPARSWEHPALVDYLAAAAQPGPERRMQIVDISSSVPNATTINNSFIKLRHNVTKGDPLGYSSLIVHDEQWLSLLEASGWLDCAGSYLKTACTIADQLTACSTCIHDGEGRDTGAVVSSLVQIILDPYCRTLVGFSQLIEREWVRLGHPFSTRSGHVTTPLSPPTTPGWQAQWQGQPPAPITKAPFFLLFLDCVHQLVQQCSSSFQFTEHYLVFLADMQWACRYGTFLYDSDMARQERQDAGITTVCLWEALPRDLGPMECVTLLVNPLFAQKKSPLAPVWDPPALRLWSQFYLRWMPEATINTSTALNSLQWRLLADIRELEREVVTAGISEEEAGPNTRREKHRPTIGRKRIYTPLAPIQTLEHGGVRIDMVRALSTHWAQPDPAEAGVSSDAAQVQASASFRAKKGTTWFLPETSKT